jgi:hypothetical protein
LASDQRFEARAYDGGLFLNAAQASGPLEQVIIDVQCVVRRCISSVCMADAHPATTIASADDRDRHEPAGLRAPVAHTRACAREKGFERAARTGGCEDGEFVAGRRCRDTSLGKPSTWGCSVVHSRRGVRRVDSRSAVESRAAALEGGKGPVEEERFPMRHRDALQPTDPRA